ncbi:MAG: potassium transporter TrkH [Bacteroidetes bacterium]|nr:MAG: potassium transporter TrkH [Bacteroidota bacterium]TAG89634.1 MAG: potassium transporter TrkH [Bacteroidota bacterium]
MTNSIKKTGIKRILPEQHLFVGFLVYTLIGTLLLFIPFAQKKDTSFLDCLFAATSAISTTGLLTVSLYDNFTFFGQFIIMLLIQIGGIGYMTFSSFIILTGAKRLSNFRIKVFNTGFTMPKGFNPFEFIRSIIIFTVVIETIGALLFFIAFVNAGVPIDFAIWSSIFHSVSTFCTAGFGLYNNSFENYPTHYFLNIIIIVLSYLGAMGFIVLIDVWNYLTKKTKEITFTSKVIILVTFALSFVGTLIIFFTEPSIQKYATMDRLLISLFQAMSALTTVGFNSIPISTMVMPVLLILTFLMYIGASPSGTGGGMKSTTLTSVVSVVYSRLIGSKKVQFLGKEIPEKRVDMAVAVFIFYTSWIFLGVFVLSFTEKATLTSLLFEVCSSLGTVGLSAGLTGSLTSFGKIVLTFLMFIGRVGVLTFGIALFSRQSDEDLEKVEPTDLAV